MKKEKGNIGDLLGTGFCILAMLTVMMFFLKEMEMIQVKAQAGQVSRKYMLRMESDGYLKPDKEAALRQDLQQLGILGVTLDGTTRVQVSYGEVITLHFTGNLTGGQRIEESRVSTAKN